MNSWKAFFFFVSFLVATASAEEAAVHQHHEVNAQGESEPIQHEQAPEEPVVPVRVCDAKLEEQHTRILQLEHELNDANQHKEKLLHEIGQLRTSLDQSRARVSEVETLARDEVNDAKEAFKTMQIEAQRASSRVAELQTKLELAELEIKELESLNLFKSLQTELKTLLAKFRSVIIKFVRKEQV